MKIIHLSDLHLGKRISDFSMLEDQAYILDRITEIIAAEKPDAVLIAGDVYDKPVPPAEAVALFNTFISRVSEMKIKLFIISGNHDSDVRIAFGSEIFRQSGIFISPVYNGTVEPVTLADSFGEVDFYLMPFVKPAHVRACFEDEEIGDYTDALRVAVKHMNVNTAKRNAILAHQFVTGAARCESELEPVGGTENVDGSVFDCFDYAALGHLHGPQKAGRDAVRYCGTPLKYSFSEVNHKKSVTVVELREKGSVEIRAVPLKPLRDMREIKGSYEELTLRQNYAGTETDDYLHITLTDEDDIPNVLSRLRTIYPNIMKLDYDNSRTRSAGLTDEIEYSEQKSGLELLEELYLTQTGKPMSDEQIRIAADIFENIKEEA